jgi:arylsulfatase A-like enzyme
MNIDIAPTILDFAGIPIPERMQGRSWKRILQGDPPQDWPDALYYSYYENSWAFRDMNRDQMTDPSFQFWTAHRVGPNRGIRTDRYKLIEYYTEGPYWELFDLESDPHELNNLADDNSYAELRQDLTNRLRAVQNAYGDQG